MPDAKLLLTSVFKPFGVDDAYGVKENVCELMNNQVTRGQGVFSIRSHNRSFGLTFMAENLQTPTTVLDFPTLEEFEQELKTGGYTHVGISFIVPNVDKARRMAEAVRRLAPCARLYLGGHGASIEELERLIPADGICRGEGVAWLRRQLGEPLDRPLVHPAMPVDCWRKLLGVPAPNQKAILIPGVGCRNKCNFCATSHFFDGYTPFFTDTAVLFDSMCRIADTLHTRDFFVLDENFLDRLERVEELARLMEERRRLFHLDIFSSLRTVAGYDPLFLVRLGVQFVWIGIESKRELYDKVKGIDAAKVIRDLRDHGISVLVSTMLFLEHHDEQGLKEDVDYTISLEPDFVQFMEYSALPGTALYESMQKQGRILKEIPYQEWHGQDRIWFRHPHFSPEQTKERLDQAFARDFEILGPSLLRIAETRIRPLLKRLPTDDPFLAQRLLELRDAAREMYPLIPTLVRMAPNAFVRRRAEMTAALYEQRLGPMSLADRVAAGVVALLARLEERRVRLGDTVHQPPTFRDTYRQG